MAKFCTYCGCEVLEEAVICMNCGCEIKKMRTVPTIKNQSKTEKTSYASLVLGVIGIVFAFIFAIVGHATSIIGIVLGIQEYAKTKQVAGIVVSIVGEVLSILSSLFGLILTINSY